MERRRSGKRSVRVSSFSPRESLVECLFFLGVKMISSLALALATHEEVLKTTKMKINQTFQKEIPSSEYAFQ